MAERLSLSLSFKSCTVLCNLNCSTPAFLVHHYLPEFVQTHFHSVMPSNYLILCHSFLFLPSIFPSIRVFSNESVLYLNTPKYWSFNFNISPSDEYSGLISVRMDWLEISSQSKGLSRVFSNTTVQKDQLFCAQPSLWSNSHTHI